MERLVARVNGARITKARHGKGWTQAQLARAVGTSERNIFRWEHSKNQPRLSSVVLIAEATGHPLEFFLTGSDEADDELEAAPMTREMATMLDTLVDAVKEYRERHEVGA